MFSPGELSAGQAAALTELWRQYQRYGMRVRVTNWPLTVSELGRLNGQIVGIDPKAFPGDGSGTGGQFTAIKDICLDGAGGGYVRYFTYDVDLRATVDEWCEPIGVCGSGDNGNLCDDLPASGSGSGTGATVATDCCPYNEVPETLYLTVSGEASSFMMGWNGTEWDTGIISLTGCGDFRFQMRCVSGTGWRFFTVAPGTNCVVSLFSSYAEACDPFEVSATGTLAAGPLGCSCPGSSKTFTVTP